MVERIVILSGATGTGKTSISQLLAKNAPSDNAVHIHSDDFYTYIKKGFIFPWEGETGGQNEAVIEAVAASAKSFAVKGYEVYVDGVIGPWFIEPWIGIAKNGIDVRYVVLRPEEKVTIARATEREQKEDFPLNREVVSEVWQAFADLGAYEPHAVDTTGQTVEESVERIQTMLQKGSFQLK